MKDVRVEVKVCEGCGALYLRAAGPLMERRGVYCRGCEQRLAEFPAARRRGLRAPRRMVRSMACVGGGR
jgi:hypothetical protein